MSGGEVVAIRGGIDVRTDDLRAVAAIMSELGFALWQDISDLEASATRLRTFMYQPGDRAAMLESGGVGLTRLAAEDAARLAEMLRAAAAIYDDEESGLERRLGDVDAVAKNYIKASVWFLSAGQLDTPWEYDGRAVELLADLVDRTDVAGLGTILVGMAAILDWRGTPVVTATGVDGSVAGTTPPRSAADLLDGVERLGSSGDSDVSVQFLEYSDGRPRQVIVTLPGTSQLVPGTDTPTDLAGDLIALQGMPSSYSDGVIEMLELAGVTDEDRILLVGHSLGGMVAATLARQLSGSGRFTVTNIVTAGSPISKIDIPDDVEALALENRGDPIPHLDAAPNEASDNVTTITVDTGRWGLNAHYLSEGYLPALDAVTASEAPRIEHALEGLQPFLEADSTTTRTYTIARP